MQDRLVFAARIDREPHGGLSMRDFQTAQLGANDRGWTTRGQPEARAGGSNTYLAPHLRYRDYFADMCVTVALRLDPADDAPMLDGLANALQEPSRPLFIGRKPCLPSAPMFGGFSDGDTALDALLAWPVAEPDDPPKSMRLFWPGNDAPTEIAGVRVVRDYMITDQRNWVSGLHGGGRPVHDGTWERGPQSGNDEDGQE